VKKSLEKSRRKKIREREPGCNKLVISFAMILVGRDRSRWILGD